MTIEFSGEVWYWRGPAPFFFMSLPTSEALRVKEVSSLVTYGWGVIPVKALIGKSEWSTSLFPKDGGYALPLKLSVRRAEGIDEGDTVSARIEVVGP